VPLAIVGAAEVQLLGHVVAAWMPRMKEEPVAMLRQIAGALGVSLAEPGRAVENSAGGDEE
jgi:hypothetical protein